MDDAAVSAGAGYKIPDLESSEENLSEYFKFVETDNVRKQMMKYAAGNQHVNIGQDSLKKVIIPYLNIQQQETIANIFMKFDKEIEVISKEINEYEKLKKGLMQQLLTGKIKVRI